jgi:hypothetical protein
MRDLREIIPMLEPVSNQATWRDTVELRDEDDELIDLEQDVTAITFRVRDTECDSTVLEATLAAATIDVVGDGVFQFVFTQAQMQTLDPKIYEVGALVTVDGDVEQVILGRIPVLKGL